MPLSRDIPISLVPSYLPRESRLRLRKGRRLRACLVGIHHCKKWIWIWDSPWIRSTMNLNSVEHLLRSFTKMVNLASRFTNLVDPNLVEEKVFGKFFGESRLINPNSVNLNPFQTARSLRITDSGPLSNPTQQLSNPTQPKKYLCMTEWANLVFNNKETNRTAMKRLISRLMIISEWIYISYTRPNKDPGLPLSHYYIDFFRNRASFNNSL
jgi:hypothetical protein